MPPVTEPSEPKSKSTADKIPFGEKVAYACGEPVGNWGSSIPGGMAPQVLNMSMGLPPSWLSTVSAIATLWDAITDPIMGWLSDNTRSRFGRRRPYILIGGILTAAVFPMFWLFSAGWSHVTIILWFLGISLLFNTVRTVWNMPYQSLLLEMTASYNERTSVSAYRAWFGKFAALGGGWIWAITQLPIFANGATGEPDTLTGIRYASLVVAILMLAGGILPALFCKERYYVAASRSKKEPLLRSLWVSLSNKPFLILCGLLVSMSLGGALVGSFSTYVLTYYVKNGSQQGASILHGWSQTIAAVAGLLSITVFTWMAARWGKDRTLRFVLICKVLIGVAIWFCYTPAYPWLSVIPGIFAGPITGAVWLLVPSMMADVVDDDELRTGERREGSFAAVFSWCLKLTYTLAAALTGPMLEMTGFRAELGADQPTEALFRMRVMMVAFPIAGLIGSFILLSIYPLTRGRMAEIRAALESRRGSIG